MAVLAPSVLVVALAVGAAPARTTTRPAAKPAAIKPAAPEAPKPPEPLVPAGQRAKVAVLELSGLGITDIAKNLEQYLRNSIATIDGFQVLSAVDVQMALQDPKNRAVATCGGGVDCAIRVGKTVGADVVVIGSLTGLGEAFSLNLRAVDVNRSRELSRYQATVSGRDKLIPEVRLAAYRLVAPDRIRGWLVVELDVPGATVEVDNQAVGTTPLEKPVENLTPGSHLVVIKHPAFALFKQQVAIRPFEPTRLTISLESQPK